MATPNDTTPEAKPVTSVGDAAPAMPDTGVAHIPNTLFNSLVAVPTVRAAVEELMTAWADELRSEKEHKWRVGVALVKLQKLLTEFNQHHHFFPTVKDLLKLSKQQTQHRMRVVNNEKEIRDKATQNGVDFDRLTWTDMLNLIRSPRKSKPKKPEAKPDPLVTEIDRTGDTTSLVNDTATPPYTVPTSPVSAKRTVRFAAAVIKEKMTNRKIKGSVVNLLELVKEIAGVEVLLVEGGEQ